MICVRNQILLRKMDISNFTHVNELKILHGSIILKEWRGENYNVLH
jgi:hypothetical protein